MCEHLHTHCLDKRWPTGEFIEVCDSCGMSRALWAGGESDWQQIELETARADLEKLFKEADVEIEYYED